MAPQRVTSAQAMVPRDKKATNSTMATNINKNMKAGAGRRVFRQHGMFGDPCGIETQQEHKNAGQGVTASLTP
jgi:hypothetical protein